MFQKTKPFRSKRYTDWVKTQCSVISGLPADDPHHIMGHGLTGGTKAPDWSCIPLTREEHTIFHDIGYEAWESINGSQADLLIKFWRDNFEEIRTYMKN